MRQKVRLHHQIRPMIDNTAPHLNRCHGVEPNAAHGETSIISCPICKEKVTVKTAPFFRNPERQHEHQAWRAALAWNAMTTK